MKLNTPWRYSKPTRFKSYNCVISGLLRFPGIAFLLTARTQHVLPFLLWSLLGSSEDGEGFSPGWRQVPYRPSCMPSAPPQPHTAPWGSCAGVRFQSAFPVFSVLARANVPCFRRRAGATGLEKRPRTAGGRADKTEQKTSHFHLIAPLSAPIMAVWAWAASCLPADSKHFQKMKAAIAPLLRIRYSLLIRLNEKINKNSNIILRMIKTQKMEKIQFNAFFFFLPLWNLEE